MSAKQIKEEHVENGASKLEKLKFRTKLLYGFGELSQMTQIQVLTMFLLFYLTSYVGINPAAVGTMMLIARIWDAINDPIMGTVIDNTNTRWGKARPYLLFGPIPLAIFFVLCFAIPNISMTGRIVWMYVAYIGHGMLYTMTGISYTTLIPRVTSDPIERVSMNTFRIFISFIAILGVPILVPIFSERLAVTTGSNQTAYLIIVACLSVVVVAGYYIVFFGVKERIIQTSKKKVNVKEGMFSLLRNKYFVRIFISTLSYNISASIVSGSVLFYVTYNLMRPELTTSVMLAALVPIIIAVFFVTPIVKKIGKRNAAIIGIIVNISAYMVRFITKDQDIVLLFSMIAIAGFGMAFYMILQVPFITDCTEYGEWKTGVRAEALALSANSFGNKLGMGVGPAILGFMLDRAGFIANAPEQTKQVTDAIFNVVVLAPMIAAIIMFFMLLTYKLDKEMPKIFKELEIRKM